MYDQAFTFLIENDEKFNFISKKEYEETKSLEKSNLYTTIDKYLDKNYLMIITDEVTDGADEVVHLYSKECTVEDILNNKPTIKLYR